MLHWMLCDILCPEAMGDDDPADAAMCAKCGVLMGNWERDIDPIAAHNSLCPECPGWARVRVGPAWKE